MLQGAGCHIRRVCGVLQVIQTDSPVVPGRAHSGFEVWPYATRFTNDRTGHGMFVSIDNVSSF